MTDTKKKNGGRVGRTNLGRLAADVRRIADMLERRRESWWKKFVLGIAFGAGTALGASFIATLVVYLVVRALAVAGVDTSVIPLDVGRVMGQ